MLAIARIQINHLKEPAGIQGKVRVGWEITSDHKNVIQKGYQMQVAKDDGFKEVVYDTGMREDGESQNISLDMPDLESIRYYYVRVKIWDNYEEVSDWHRTHFLSALSDKDVWMSDFITAEQLKDKSDSPATKLRREFKVEKPLKEAFLVATACGLYHTYLNGTRVGDEELAPGWTSYEKRILYQTYDVTEMVVQGVNTWGALVGAGWYKGDISYYRIHNFYGDHAAFSGELILRFEDGSEEIVCTDNSWKGADSPILFSDIYDGEIYDARLEEEGWNESGYADDNWRAVKKVEQKREQLYPQSGCAVQIKETLQVQEVLVTPKGEMVLDFGQNISGWVHMQVVGQPGDIVELVCFEILDAEGNVYTDNLRTAKQTIRYFCKGEGQEEYHPYFTFQGFRYVWVKQYPGKISGDHFKALVLYSDIEEIGTFRCSNPFLNQLQKNIMRGLKGNSVDIPSDCPQRDERLGWTGDVNVFCDTACYLMGMYEFYRKWLCDLSADQQENGAVTHVVPDVLAMNQPDNFSGASGWGDVSVTLPWNLYQETGDKEIIDEQYQSMKAWVDFLIDHTEDHIFSFGPQFGDWLALDAEEGSYHGATPVELTAAAYSIKSLGLFAKMASIVGREADDAQYQGRQQELIRHFQGRYFLSNGQMTVRTQTAHVLALNFGLVPEQNKEVVIKDLLALLEQNTNHLSTGFLGTPFILYALSENDCLDTAYELLMKDDFPSWLYQVKQGATTVWEHWDGRKPDGSMWSADMNSFNHYAYGAVGQWLYSVCAGLKRDDEAYGYQHFFIEPNIGGDLSFAETSHVSEYGEILVRWERLENKVSLHAKIPHNCTATIRLKRGEKLLDDDGLKFHQDKNIIIADVGSGEYCISYAI